MTDEPTKETEETPSAKEAKAKRSPVPVEEKRRELRNKAEGLREKTRGAHAELLTNVTQEADHAREEGADSPELRQEEKKVRSKLEGGLRGAETETEAFLHRLEAPTIILAETEETEEGVKELLYRDIEKKRGSLLEIGLSREEGWWLKAKDEFIRVCGFPPFVEMTPEEISQDDELLFHSMPGETALKVLSRGNLDSKMVQREKYGYAEKYTQFSSFSKDSGISFCRGGSYWQGGLRGVAFAFRAKELLPNTLFDEKSHDPGEVRIYDSELDPKNPEVSKGATVDLTEKNFVILVGKRGHEWFLEEIRRNWESLPIKDRYENADEFIAKHIVELPELYKGKIRDYLETNKEQILESFPDLRDVLHERGAPFEQWAYEREEDNFEVGGVSTIFSPYFFTEFTERPYSWSWNIAGHLLSLRLLEQEFNKRFPEAEKPPLVKIEKTEKKFGFPGETPLRQVVAG